MSLAPAPGGYIVEAPIGREAIGLAWGPWVVESELVDCYETWPFVVLGPPQEYPCEFAVVPKEERGTVRAPQPDGVTGTPVVSTGVLVIARRRG